MANALCKSCGKHERVRLQRGVKLANIRSYCCSAPLASAFWGYSSDTDPEGWGLMERTKENIKLSQERGERFRQERIRARLSSLTYIP
jgi:hypothetical protein